MRDVGMWVGGFLTGFGTGMFVLLLHLRRGAK